VIFITLTWTLAVRKTFNCSDDIQYTGLTRCRICDQATVQRPHHQRVELLGRPGSTVFTFLISTLLCSAFRYAFRHILLLVLLATNYHTSKLIVNTNSDMYFATARQAIFSSSSVSHSRQPSQVYQHQRKASRALTAVARKAKRKMTQTMSRFTQNRKEKGTRTAIT
jgi:hypothetical protein